MCPFTDKIRCIHILLSPFIEPPAYYLLFFQPPFIFSIFSSNQKNSINSIVAFETVQMSLNKVIHQITRNGTLASLKQFYGKMWVVFSINTETRFITEISTSDQWKESNLFCKTVIRFFKIYLSKKSARFYMWAART